MSEDERIDAIQRHVRVLEPGEAALTRSLAGFEPITAQTTVVVIDKPTTVKSAPRILKVRTSELHAESASVETVSEPLAEQLSSGIVTRLRGWNDRRHDRDWMPRAERVRIARDKAFNDMLAQQADEQTRKAREESAREAAEKGIVVLPKPEASTLSLVKAINDDQHFDNTEKLEVIGGIVTPLTLVEQIVTPVEPQVFVTDLPTTEETESEVEEFDDDEADDEILGGLMFEGDEETDDQDHDLSEVLLAQPKPRREKRSVLEASGLLRLRKSTTLIASKLIELSSRNKKTVTSDLRRHVMVNLNQPTKKAKPLAIVAELVTVETPVVAPIVVPEQTSRKEQKDRARSPRLIGAVAAGALGLAAILTASVATHSDHSQEVTAAKGKTTTTAPTHTQTIRPEISLAKPVTIVAASAAHAQLIAKSGDGVTNILQQEAFNDHLQAAGLENYAAAYNQIVAKVGTDLFKDQTGELQPGTVEWKNEAVAHTVRAILRNLKNNTNA